jgi:hypothetical protein
MLLLLLLLLLLHWYMVAHSLQDYHGGTCLAPEQLCIAGKFSTTPLIHMCCCWSTPQAQLQQFKLSEVLTAAQRKQRNTQYKAALEAQIAEAEARSVLDDVFMAERERELNRRLIVTARGMMSSMGMGH